MLAPDINTTKNQLTTIFNEVTSITGFSIGVQDTQIGTLPLEPSWLPSVRSEMKLLSEKGASWMINYPDSFASILTPFMDYATDFSAVNDKIKKNKQDPSKTSKVSQPSRPSTNPDDNFPQNESLIIEPQNKLTILTQKEPTKAFKFFFKIV